MSSSRLLDLPPELRNFILDLVVRGDGQFRPFVTKSGLWCPRRICNSETDMSAIANVCWQLRYETLPSILSEVFVFLDTEIPKPKVHGRVRLPDWDGEESLDGLALLGPGAIKHVRQLSFYAGIYETWTKPGRILVGQMFEPAFDITIDFSENKATVYSLDYWEGSAWYYGGYHGWRSFGPKSGNFRRDCEDFKEVLEDGLCEVKSAGDEAMSPREIMQLLGQRMIEWQEVEFPLMKWYELTGQA